MDTYGLTRWLTRVCADHWYLRRFLDPLYRHAERKGYKDLVRENAHRILERAHVEHLTGGEEARETASHAMDRFENLACQGDPDAAFHIAEAHRTGFGRPRNHWKAIEHYERAVSLGHPGAHLRLQQVKAGEEIQDDRHEAFGRKALLKATYTRKGGEARIGALKEGLGEIRHEGVGRRGVWLILTAAGLVLGYLALDIYFFGMGAWRPDPGRVVWGIFGKVHPPREDGVGAVMPGWLRPDARSVAFEVSDVIHQRSGKFSLGDYEGKVVYIYVVDGKHPMVHEAVPYLRGLSDRQDPQFAFVLLYLPFLESRAGVQTAVQWAVEIPPAIVDSPKAARPLGTMRTFPMNFVLDRRGRIRQRWAGYSEALAEAAINGALAEK